MSWIGGRWCVASHAWDTAPICWRATTRWCESENLLSLKCVGCPGSNKRRGAPAVLRRFCISTAHHLETKPGSNYERLKLLAIFSVVDSSSLRNRRQTYLNALSLQWNAHQQRRIWRPLRRDWYKISRCWRSFRKTRTRTIFNLALQKKKKKRKKRVRNTSTRSMLSALFNVAMSWRELGLNMVTLDAYGTA